MCTLKVAFVPCSIEAETLFAAVTCGLFDIATELVFTLSNCFFAKLLSVQFAFQNILWAPVEPPERG